MVARESTATRRGGNRFSNLSARGHSYRRTLGTRSVNAIAEISMEVTRQASSHSERA